MSIEHINAVTVLAVMNIHHIAGLLSVRLRICGKGFKKSLSESVFYRQYDLQKFTYFTGKFDIDFTFATQTLRIFTKESEKELNGFVHTVN